MLQHRHVAYGRVETSIKDDGNLVRSEDESSAWPIIAIALVLSLLASSAAVIMSDGWRRLDDHFSSPSNNSTTYEMIKSVSRPSLCVNDSWCGYGAAPSEEVLEKSIVDGGAYDEAIKCHANEGDMRRAQLVGRFKVTSDFEINRNQSIYTMSND